MNDPKTHGKSPNLLMFEKSEARGNGQLAWEQTQTFHCIVEMLHHDLEMATMKSEWGRDDWDNPASETQAAVKLVLAHSSPHLFPDGGWTPRKAAAQRARENAINLAHRFGMRELPVCPWPPKFCQLSSA